MELIGQAIRHETFGKGVVTGQQQNVLTICFSEGEKKFIYPDAFEKHLTLKNPDMQKKIQSVLEKRDEAEEQRLHAIQEKEEQKERLNSMRISPRSQAAFDVHPGEEEQTFADWAVSTGCYVSGYSKGEPRIPDRLKPNSVCVLTRHPEGGTEAERCIIGAFMVPEDFLGCYCHDGIISAHQDYRLRLTEPIPFWPYVSSESGRQRWGKTTMKYLDNEAAERILFDVAKLSHDAEEKDAAVRFYQYYCNINRLPIRQTEA